MDDKSALLQQLRIDRTGAPQSPSRWKLWMGVAAAVVLAAGAGIWSLRGRSAAIAVRVVAARGPSGRSQSGSVLDASGYVVARRQATVASKITARMVDINIEEGEHVKAGQIIARLDDTNVRAALEQTIAQLNFAKAGLAETQVNLTNAQRDYDRQKSLMQGHFVSQSTVDNAQTSVDALRAQLATQRSNVDVVSREVNVAERNTDDTIVRAPFAGVVTVKAAQPGEMVSPVSAGGGFTRTGICTIVDMDSLEIQVDVNENFINRVHPDQSATATLNAYPDWQIPAHVVAVIPTAERSKGTVTVRIALDQKDGRIFPEMGVRVSFHQDSAQQAASAPSGVTLPKDALLESNGQGVVYVVHADTVERRPVRLGAGSSDGIVVLSGLAAGEVVAEGNLDQLKDGATVRVEQQERSK